MADSVEYGGRERVYALLAAILIAFSPLLLQAIVASADGFEVEEEREEYEDEGLEETAEAAGSAAFALGVTANALFVGYKWARLHVRLKGSYRSVLDAHILSNIILGLLAVYHGYSLRSTAGPVEYASIAAVLVLLSSGLLLRYAKNRRLKWFARHLHIQRILAVILLGLVILHIYTIED
ncbi:MAG: hypothetical protein LRS43_04630 [Desulfurococcales archaeon]|nr:hypothetical protein [Desulfurococcales archaeon]